MVGRQVVLGLGGATDYELEWQPEVLQDLARGYGVRPEDLSTSIEVVSERDLVCSVLAFLRDSVGGERSVRSPGILETFADRFERRCTLGGTSVRAALAMSRIGLTSTVHLVSIDDDVRRLLPPEISYLSSATEDSTHPHLIVQFPKGARIEVGDVTLTTSRSNRLIYVNDPPNSELRLSPDLGHALENASVFLISGLNAIVEPCTLDERLRELRRHMQSLPEDALVIYEDAGFHVPALSGQVRDALLDTIDVYSMNEDEMQAHLHRRVDLHDAEAVAVGLEELRALIPARTLVVHTKFWSLALGHEAEQFRAALRGGTAMAGARYQYGDSFSARDYHAVGREPARQDGLEYARAIETLLPQQVCCVPSHKLLTQRPTTIGLGDAFVGGFIAELAFTDKVAVESVSAQDVTRG